METKATHQVEVVPVKLLPHPNADSMSLVKIDHYQVCVRTEDWEGIETGAYIKPDTMVPLSHPSFEFLKARASDGATYYRIKVMKLRGEYSMGFLAPTPKGSSVGDDVSEILGTYRYEPPLNVTDSKAEQGGPECFYVKYDVDPARKFAKKAFIVGEPLRVYEKIHGCLHEDTLVTIANGKTIPIKDVKPGSKVKSYNLTTKMLQPDTVKALIIRDETNNWLKLEFENGRTLICTENHPILTNKGYIKASDLTDEYEIICV